MSEGNRSAGPDVNADLEKVESLIDTAHRLLGEDTMVDLSALEGKVSALCEALREVPPEAARSLEERLAAVLANLDKLAAGLVEHHRRLGEKLGDGRRRQAPNDREED